MPKSGYLKLNDALVWESEWCGEPAKEIRGVTTFLIDPLSCSVAKLFSFDTHASQIDAEDLAAFLNSVPDGKVVIGLTSDEPTANLKSALPALLQLAVDVSDVEDRGSFAFITQKGSPEKTVISKALTAEESDANPAHFKAVITGTQYAVASAPLIAIAIYVLFLTVYCTAPRKLMKRC